MSKLYVAEEWISASGKVNIQSVNLVGTGRNWREPAKILGLSVPDFILKLREEYEAELKVFKNEEGKIMFIDYYWRDLAKARKYKNYINLIARNKNYKI